MATPTAQRVRDIAVAWWQLPGVPRLDTLAAMIAAEFTDEIGVSGRLTIEIVTVNNELALQATLQRGNNAPVVRLWQPTSSVRQENLLDVFDPALGMTRRRFLAMQEAQTP